VDDCTSVIAEGGTGEELVVDAFGCDPETLRSRSTLQSLVSSLVRELRLTLVGHVRWHQFPPPGGITALVLLSESHIALHTFPEYGLATFNLFSCGPRCDWPWAVRLHEMLHATQVTVRVLPRGVRTSALESPSPDTAPRPAIRASRQTTTSLANEESAVDPSHQSTPED
jgi:S-adenosylmethionine decarboxylase